MKTLKITFLEGSANGLREVTEDNWSGACRIASRSYIQKAFETEKLQESGVYILIGPCDLVGDNKLSSKVYIGKSDSLDERLAQHHKSKDFWTTAFVFFRKNDPLHLAHAGYLESRLIKLAKEAGNSVLDNAAVPKPPHLNETDKESIEQFLKKVETVMQALGHDLFTVRQVAHEDAKQPTVSGTLDIPDNLRELVNSFKKHCLALKFSEVYATQIPDLRAKVVKDGNGRVYSTFRFQKHGVRLSIRDHGVTKIGEGEGIGPEIIAKLTDAHSKCLKHLSQKNG